MYVVNHSGSLSQVAEDVAILYDSGAMLAILLHSILLSSPMRSFCLCCSCRCDITVNNRFQTVEPNVVNITTFKHLLRWHSSSLTFLMAFHSRILYRVTFIWHRSVAFFQPHSLQPWRLLWRLLFSALWHVCCCSVTKFSRHTCACCDVMLGVHLVAASFLPSPTPDSCGINTAICLCLQKGQEKEGLGLPVTFWVTTTTFCDGVTEHYILVCTVSVHDHAIGWCVLSGRWLCYSFVSIATAFCVHVQCAKLFVPSSSIHSCP